jgi:flagellar M-ring protein FliF
VVYLEPNLKLSNDQIKGITLYVKMSYTGLTDDNISIVDGYGIPQIAGEEDIDVIADETRKFAFKTNLENSIKEKILELLTPVYNDDGVSVAVNMVLNFDDKVSEDTKYTPSNEDGKGMLQHETGSSCLWQSGF